MADLKGTHKFEVEVGNYILPVEAGSQGDVQLVRNQGDKLLVEVDSCLTEEAGVGVVVGFVLEDIQEGIRVE